MRNWSSSIECQFCCYAYFLGSYWSGWDVDASMQRGYWLFRAVWTDDMDLFLTSEKSSSSIYWIYPIIHINCLLWLEVYPIKTGKFWSNFQIFDWKQRRCLANKMCPTFLQTLIDQFNSVGWGVLNVFLLVEIWLTFSKLNQLFFLIKRKCRITWPLSPWTRVPLLTGTATDPLPRLSSSCFQSKSVAEVDQRFHCHWQTQINLC